MKEHWVYYEFDDEPGPDGHCLAHVKPASQDGVDKVLNSYNGHSQWVWVTLANGDLILGVYPQGDTYEVAAQEANA